MEAWREEVADRDPDTIKRDIDQARDQLASTVDTLAERANPQRIAERHQSGRGAVREEAGGRGVAGSGRRPRCCGRCPPHPAALTSSGQQRRAERNQSANEKLGGLATRPRRLQVYTMMGRCAVTSSAEPAPDAPAVSDASTVASANTSFRRAHGPGGPCDLLQLTEISILSPLYAAHPLGSHLPVTREDAFQIRRVSSVM